MLVFFAGNSNLFSQDINTVENKQDSIIIDNEIYWSVEQQPQFPGGSSEMLKYISSNLKIPKNVKPEEGLRSKIIVRFVVEKDGSMSDISVFESIYPSQEEEIINLIRSMPKWIPGMHFGKAVRVYYSLPIRICFRNPI